MILVFYKTDNKQRNIRYVSESYNPKIYKDDLEINTFRGTIQISY